MQIRFRATLAALCSIILLADVLATATACRADAQQISIAGSSTLLPVIEQVAKRYQFYHPQVRFVLDNGGSAIGISAVASGRVQIGLASRDLNDDEIRRYPNLISVKIGIDGIALVVRAGNPVSQITTRQIQDVYSGQIADWQPLGGRATPIVLISTNENHGTFDAFCQHFKLDARPAGRAGGDETLLFRKKGADHYSSHGAIALDGNSPVLAALAREPNGLAYASIGFALRRIAAGAPVKILDVDGVTPTMATVRNGTYAAQRPLLVITKGKPAADVDLFLHYLVSPAGRQIVEDMDCISPGSSESRNVSPQ